MDEKKILEAARFYQEALTTFIRNYGFEVNPVRLAPNESKLSLRQKLNHCLWLAQEIPNLLIQRHYEQPQRWLAFIQGTLWALDLITIEEAKNQNRPD